MSKVTRFYTLRVTGHQLTVIVAALVRADKMFPGAKTLAARLLKQVVREKK